MKIRLFVGFVFGKDAVRLLDEDGSMYCSLSLSLS